LAAKSAKSRSSGATPTPDAAVPETVEEALSRARYHGRLAAAESVAALQALLDSAALGLSGRAAERDAILGPLSRSMEELRALIAPDDSRFGSSLLSALFDALDAEIARWELRSREDPNARSVLRAFLGVREILWEISARGRAPEASAEEGATAGGETEPSAGPVRSRRSTRVQRVRVEG
jgi:hypothetical protein